MASLGPPESTGERRPSASANSEARMPNERVRHAIRGAFEDIEPEICLPIFVEVLHQILGFSAMSVTEIINGTYAWVYGWPEPGITEEAHAKIEGSSLEFVMRGGGAVAVGGDSAGRFESDAALFPEEVASYILLPVVGDQGIIGTVNLGFTRADEPSDDLLELARECMSAAAKGLRNTLLFSKQQRIIHELREQDAQKNDFIAILAHDLRSALATVVGYADTLNGDWATFPDDVRRDLAAGVARNAHKLSEFASEVLQLTHIESGEFGYDIQSFDMDALVYMVVEGVEREGLDRVRISVEPNLPAASGDPIRQWQILANLLSNALKYSPADRLVHVTARPKGDSIVVSVQDEGAGIDPEDLDRLFERFARGERSGRLKGTGLGLYICKRMVEAQGGSISVVSEPGEGSTFSYTTPISFTEA